MSMPTWSDLPDGLQEDLRRKAAKRARASRQPFGIFARPNYRGTGDAVRFEVVKPAAAPDTWKLLLLVAPRRVAPPVPTAGISRQDIRRTYHQDMRKRAAPWEGRGQE